MATLRTPLAFNKIPSGDATIDLLQDRISECVRSLVQAVTESQRLQVFANNAKAVAGGLAVGALYRNGADPDLVCVVH